MTNQTHTLNNTKLDRDVKLEQVTIDNEAYFKITNNSRTLLQNWISARVNQIRHYQNVKALF